MNSRTKIQRKVDKAGRLLKQASQELAEARGEALVMRDDSYDQLRVLKDLIEAVYGAILSGPYQ